MREQQVLAQTRSDLALARQQADLHQARSERDALEGELILERSTRQGLEAALHKAQDELGRANDKLAFFEQLFPPGPAGSVSIRAFDIDVGEDTIGYRVLLMRNAPEGTVFEGRLRFHAEGSRDGKAERILLEPVRTPEGRDTGPASPAADPAALHFDQFQRSSGLLRLPPGFTVSSVQMDVLEGDTVRVSRKAPVL